MSDRPASLPAGRRAASVREEGSRDIIGEKVWIQYDGTNRPVAEEFVRAGIPRSAIGEGEGYHEILLDTPVRDIEMGPIRPDFVLSSGHVHCAS